MAGEYLIQVTNDLAKAPTREAAQNIYCNNTMVYHFACKTDKYGNSCVDQFDEVMLTRATLRNGHVVKLFWQHCGLGDNCTKNSSYTVRRWDNFATVNGVDPLGVVSHAVPANMPGGVNAVLGPYF